MRGAASLFLARGIKKQFHPFEVTWDKIKQHGGGIVLPALEPKKPPSEESCKGRRMVADEKGGTAEPIAAFSRPPPLSPFLGSLVILSMLDSWSRRDTSDA